MILFRSKRFFSLCWLALAVGASLLGGCEKLQQFNRADRAIDQAEQKQSSGDYRGAVDAYEKALDGTSKTADTHFRLALIYDEKLHDPVGAVHHLHRYLALFPGGPHAREAKTTLERLELTLATSLSGGTLIPRAEANQLKAENVSLRKQLAATSNPAMAVGPRPSPAGAVARDAQGRPPPGTRTYVVQRGDTLASIARKFYKNKARARDIQDANQNSVPDPKKLKLGQTLIIP